MSKNKKGINYASECRKFFENILHIDTIHEPCLPHKKLRHIVRDNCTYEQGDLLESIQTEAAQIYTSLTRNS